VKQATGWLARRLLRWPDGEELDAVIGALMSRHTLSGSSAMLFTQPEEPAVRTGSRQRRSEPLSGNAIRRAISGNKRRAPIFRCAVSIQREREHEEWSLELHLTQIPLICGNAFIMRRHGESTTAQEEPQEYASQLIESGIADSVMFQLDPKGCKGAGQCGELGFLYLHHKIGMLNRLRFLCDKAINKNMESLIWPLQGRVRQVLKTESAKYTMTLAMQYESELRSELQKIDVLLQEHISEKEMSEFLRPLGVSVDSWYSK
jgi:hypothetical protein